MASSAITGPVFSDNKRAPAGTAAAPSFAFNDSTGTGVYLVSPGVLGLSTAGVQRVVVDASGNVGIGTGSPTNKLQVSGSGSTYMAVNSINAGSGAGLYMTNSTNSYLIGAGAASGGSGLEFRDVTNSTTRMTLDASGNLLVGKTAVDISTTGMSFEKGPSGLRVVSAASTGSSDGFQMFSTGTGTFRFFVGFNGQINATSTTIAGISDQRLKENVRDLDDGLASVMALKPRKFDWKEGKGKDIKDDRGFIAQEFEQVFPDMIEEWRDPAPEGEEPYKAVNANLIPVLVKAIQELEARLAALESK